MIAEAELEAHERDDVHAILGGVPGIYIRGEDGYGLRPNIGLRGASSDRSAKVTLMEDGVLMAPAPYSAPAAYYFPLMTRMAGIEVFKGSASIRNGPNTIGGAINFQTRSVPNTNLGYIDIAGGNFTYGKLHAYWGSSWRGFGVVLEGARVQTNGFKELDGGGDTGFGKNDFMAKIRYRTAPGRRIGHLVQVKLGVSNEVSNETYLGLSNDDFFRTPYRRYSASQTGKMNWWRTQGVLSYKVQRDRYLDFEAKAYRSDFKRSWRKLNRFSDGPSLLEILATPDSGQYGVLFAILRGEEDTQGPEQALVVGTNHRSYASEGLDTTLRWRPSLRALKQNIQVGARLHHDWIARRHDERAFSMLSGNMVSDGSPTVPGTRNRGETLAGAVYLQDAITLNERFTLSPGIRFELISSRFRDDISGSAGNRFDVVALPGLGTHLAINQWIAIIGGMHAGFSPVSPGQHRSVRPERSINYEAGARSSWKHLRAEAIGFFNDYSNLTGECTLSGGCSEEQLNRQFNAGQVQVFGVETLLDYRNVFDDGFVFGFGAQYTYTGSYFLENFVSESPQFGDVHTGDALPYVPVHQTKGHVNVGGYSWDLRAALGFTGGMRDLPGRGPISQSEGISSYAVLDLAAEIRVAGRVRIYALGNNLTNSRYMISRRPYGARPGAPLTVILGMKIHFFGSG